MAGNQHAPDKQPQPQQQNHQAPNQQLLQTSPSAKPEDYMTIKGVFEQQRATPDINKMNLYGVITFIKGAKTSPTTSRAGKHQAQVISVVDNTCGPHDRLKCVVFSEPNSALSVASSCEIGDIVRFHRVKGQMYNNESQCVVNGTFSTWIRFKRNSDTFDYVGNRSASRINDFDKAKVSELRDWLKTNPQVHALYEAGLSIEHIGEIRAMDDMDTDEAAANAANAAATTTAATTSAATTSSAAAAIEHAVVADVDAALVDAPPQSGETSTPLEPSVLARLDHVRSKLAESDAKKRICPLTYSRVLRDCFFDIVCQVCAICDTRGTKFLMAWDATLNNLAVHQEHDFAVEVTRASSSRALLAGNSESASRCWFARSLSPYLFQIYIYDEFLEQMDELEPGDFVLLKNMRSIKPSNSSADLLFKLPGMQIGGSNFGRALLKIASVDANPYELAMLKSERGIEARIADIARKGRELGATWFLADEFRNEYLRSTDPNDETLDELVMRQNLAGASTLPATSVTATATAGATAAPAPTAVTARVGDAQSATVKSGAGGGMVATRSRADKMTKVDMLLEDDNELYLTDDEDDESVDCIVSPSRQKTASTVTAATAAKSPRKASHTTTSNATASSPKPASAVQTTSVVPQPQSTTNVVKRRQKTKNDWHAISADIYKLKRLVALTPYLVPYMTMSNYNDVGGDNTDDDDDSENEARSEQRSLTATAARLFVAKRRSPQSTPYFDSLDDLRRAARHSTHMRAKVTAKFFNYAANNSYWPKPQMWFVYVLCRACGYVNYVPFHFASLHQSTTLDMLLRDSDKTSQQNDTPTSSDTDSSEDDDDDPDQTDASDAESNHSLLDSSTHNTSANKRKKNRAKQPSSHRQQQAATANIAGNDTVMTMSSDFTQECASIAGSLSTDTIDKLKLNAVNFDPDWLHTTLPIGIASTSANATFTSQTTQTSDTSQFFNGSTAAATADEHNKPLIMQYDCPRCLLKSQHSGRRRGTPPPQQSTSSKQKRRTGGVDSSPQQPPLSQSLHPLQFVYRLWFKLRDASSVLSPCLLEADVAEKWLDSITAAQFFTEPLKAHHVFQKIVTNFPKKYLFTIETFNLRHEHQDLGAGAAAKSTQLGTQPPPHVNVDAMRKQRKQPKILYKIVAIEEFFTVHSTVNKF